jgi:hypothetical protein
MIKSANKTHLASPRLRRASDVRPEALIAFVKDASEQDANPVSDLALRDRFVPLADWTEIDLAPISPSQHKDWLRNELSNALRLRQMRSEQLVILCWHNAARIALDLTLRGVITCGGIVAVDLLGAPLPDSISATVASIRIVLNENTSDPAYAKLIDVLRRRDADFRFMTLPLGGADERDVTTRATAAFLSELTARACRQ